MPFVRSPNQSARRTRPTTLAVRAFEEVQPAPSAAPTPQLRPTRSSSAGTPLHQRSMPQASLPAFRPWPHQELEALDRQVRTHRYLTAFPGFISRLAVPDADAMHQGVNRPGWAAPEMSRLLGTRQLFQSPRHAAPRSWVSTGQYSFVPEAVIPIYPMAQELVERAGLGLRPGTDSNYMPVYRYGDGLKGRLASTTASHLPGGTAVRVEYVTNNPDGSQTSEFVDHTPQELCVAPMDRGTPLALGDIVVVPQQLLLGNDTMTSTEIAAVTAAYSGASPYFGVITALDHGERGEQVKVRFYRTHTTGPIASANGYFPAAKLLLPTWEALVAEVEAHGPNIIATLNRCAGGTRATSMFAVSALPSAQPTAPAPSPSPASRARSSSSWRQYHGHGWKPAVRLIGGPSSPSTYHRRAGIELEIEIDRSYMRSHINSSDRDDLTRRAFEAVDAAILAAGGTPPTRDHEELFHGESDGSLSFGCEFPTAAISIDPLTAWRDPAVISARKGIQALVNFLQPFADESVCERNCGLHVHLTRRRFVLVNRSTHPSNDERRYYLALALTGHMLVRGMTTSKHRWGFLTRRNGTDNPGDPEYAHTGYRDPDLLDRIARGEFTGGNRYQVWNLTNQHTIEFRSCGNPWDDANWHVTAVELADSLDCFLYAMATTPGMIGHAWLEGIRSGTISTTAATRSNHPDLPPPGRFWTMWRDFASLHEPQWSNAVDALDKALDQHPVT